MRVTQGTFSFLPDLTDAQIEALANLDAAAVDQAIDAMLGDLATSKWG